jgi:hypothetical protein
MWLEDQEEEEAELDTMRAAQAPGDAIPQPLQPSAGAAAPSSESSASPVIAARTRAAAELETELGGVFGALPEEAAMSPQTVSSGRRSSTRSTPTTSPSARCEPLCWPASIA